MNAQLGFAAGAADSIGKLEKILALKKDFTVDAASVIIQDKTGTFRLPKTSARYDQATDLRGARELESERYMLNAHGTLYEVGRESGFNAIRPVTTHQKRIVDYCTWRGLLVISGTRPGAKPDGHYFRDDAGNQGL